ncbi:MAG: acetate/propionate family kinase, partial [Pseudomonadota bacterium]
MAGATAMAGDGILVLNAGSSSIKLALFGPDGVERLSGRAEGRESGLAGAVAIKLGETRRTLASSGLDEVIAVLLAMLGEAGARPAAAAHRVVHGGPDLTQPVVLTPASRAAIEAAVPLAPLHNPPALAVIDALAAAMPGLVQVACFDTAFHATLPAVARTFALPRAVREAGVRRYGFHGLSYQWLAGRLPDLLGESAQGRVVAAHLGNGASLCGLVGLKSRATTMGFTPLDGLVMGERPGLTDPGAVLFMVEEMGMSAEAVRDALFKRSGLLGLSGLSNDMRTLLASDAAEARLALDVYVHRIVREIAAIAGEIGGADALVFTGGVGENAAEIRRRVVQGLDWLGFSL